MILVFVLLLTTTVYGAERLPTVNSDNNAWGAILNNFLSVSLNGSGFLNSNIINAIQINSSVVNTTHIVDGTIIDADISDTTNLTLGEIITFTLGESIDNIVNNWIKITGALNVTNNLSVVGSATIGSQNNVASGSNSVAIGELSNATGTLSLAIGDRANASGTLSVSIGNQTNATGLNAIAMGTQATAKGDQSIAIGFQTTASGTRATAIGPQTTATNTNSVAIGVISTASGTESVALGRGNTASGDQSTAIGHTTTASGLVATSMGIQTTSSGRASLASGELSTASGSWSTALGNRTTASGTTSTAMGTSTIASGASSTSLGNITIASGSNSLAVGLRTSASGSESFAVGNNTDARGVNSIAAGIGINVTGDNSVGITLNDSRNQVLSLNNVLAIIGGNVSIGSLTPTQRLHVEGNVNATGNLTLGEIITFTLGESIDNIVNNWVKITGALNVTNNLSVVGSATIGSQSNVASGASAVAMGSGTTASSSFSVAMGDATTASGQSSTSMGASTTASGSNSVAMGDATTASGSVATAMGSQTTASGTNSLAMGQLSTASGTNSLATGLSTIASGIESTAIGKSTIASGLRSTAMGVKTSASGSFSTAIGNETDARGVNSVAIGHGINVTGDNSIGITLNDSRNQVLSLNNVLAIIGGNVSIGSLTPTQRLVVEGNVNVTGNLSVVGNATFGVGTVFIGGNNNLVGIGTTSPSENLTVLGNLSVSGTQNSSIDGSTLYIDASGNRVGIGTTDVRNKLDVEGSVAVGATFSGASTAQTNSLIVEGNLSVGTASPNANLEVNGSSTVLLVNSSTNSSELRIAALRTNLLVGSNRSWVLRVDTVSGGLNISELASGGTQLFIQNNTGNVGVGTTSPIEGLDINEDIGLAGNRNAVIRRTVAQDPTPTTLTIQSNLNTIGASPNSGSHIILYSGFNAGGNFGQIEYNTQSGGASGADSGDHIFKTGTSSLTEKMRIDIDGNVGIGSVAPNANLEVNSTNTVLLINSSTNSSELRIAALRTNALVGSNRSWVLRADTISGGLNISELATGGTQFFIQNTTGNVGIGTASPTEEFVVVGDSLLGASITKLTEVGIQSFNPTAQVLSSTGAGQGAVLYRASTSNFASPLLFARANNTYASPTIVGNGDVIGQIEFAAYDGVDFTQSTARIASFVNGTPAVNNTPGSLVFYTTTNGSDTPTERMRILENGNVGIGTTIPTEKLTVAKDAANSELHITTGSDTDGQASVLRLRKSGGTVDAPTTVATGEVIGAISFQGHDGTLFLPGTQIRSDVTTFTGTNNIETNLQFWTRATGGSNIVQRMTINGNGSVGINTTTPGNTFDVNGGIRVGVLAAAAATSVCRDANNDLSTCSSSRRYKTNITNFTVDKTKLFSLQPISFNFNNTGEYGIGLIAEEVYELIPALVFNYSGRIEGINYDQLSVYLLDVLGDHESRLNNISNSNLPTGSNGQTLRNNGAGWASVNNLYNDGTNVGINNTNPTSALHVAGTVTATAFAGDASQLTNLPDNNDGTGGWTNTTTNTSTSLNVSINNNLEVAGSINVGLERVSNTCVSAVQCSINCTAGKKVLGGGCEAYNSASYPNTDNSWNCASSLEINHTVWAICARIV